MELKVWVEGIQRIVCGVSDSTTCQDIVFALAHATGKSGRFTLIERWRSNERQLAPNENPLKILLKWGEYSNDVQFILQWSESSKSNKEKVSSAPISPTTANNIVISTTLQESHHQRTISAVSNGENNVGIVKGIPQVKQLGNTLEVMSAPASPKKSAHPVETEYPSQQRIAPPYKDPPAPPPYRDPPQPPANNKQNVKQAETRQAETRQAETRQAEMKQAEGDKKESSRFHEKIETAVMYNAQYRELVSLVNYQREQLSTQQVDLTKCDAEIVFWESKEREKQFQLDFIAQELLAMSNANRVNGEQVQALNYVEDEAEIVKQQEKTLKSELTLLRSKLANCETELLQCKNKIRLVMDEIQMEQRAVARRNESRKQLERNLMMEMERIQSDIELAKKSADLHHFTAETLKKEVASLELAIIEKKKQVEHLVQDMKEANLQSLLIAPQDELKYLFEGPNRAGSTRKIVGSPRQLENAVPTNKNPHGVWV